MLRVRIPFVGNENSVLAILLLVTTLLLVQQGWLWRFDHYFYDLQLALWERPASNDILLVRIDGTSQSELGSPPWSPAIYTQFIDNILLDNPQMVEILFPLPDSEDATGNQIEDYQQTNLNPDINQGKEYYFTEPIVQNKTVNAGDFPDSRKSLIVDRDGIVRGLSIETSSDTNLRNAAVTLMPNESRYRYSPVNQTVFSTAIGPRPPGAADNKILIPFTGSPDHYKTLSFHEAYIGSTPPGLLAGKIIIVGLADAYGQTSHPVPNYGFLDTMPVDEIYANYVDASLSNNLIQPASVTWVMVFSGIFSTIPFFIYPLFSPRGNILVGIVLVISAAFITLAIVLYFYIWIPPSAAFLAIIVSYFLWSSRRLENAVHYLDHELARLDNDIKVRDPICGNRISGVLNHLESVLPIDGWIVKSSSNTDTEQSGNVPDINNKQLSLDHWSDDGLDSWINVKNPELMIAVRWKDIPRLRPMEKIYLQTLVQDNIPKAPKSEHTSHELVHKLIQQVQNAIVGLRDTHVFLENSLAQMADGVIVTNGFGVILMSNVRANEYLGIGTNDSIEGEDILTRLDDLVLPPGASVSNSLRDSIASGRPVSIQASSHSGRDLLLQIAPVSNKTLQPGNIIFNLSDISHLKSVERARNETLSFISHDLRSPLVSILALLELAKNRKTSDEITSLHTRIEGYTKLTINLAEQFIQLARVESDAGIRFETIDVVSLAINAHENMWVQAQAKEITMVRKIEIEHGWIHGDSSLIERAISNLLNNAIKYSPKGSKVSMQIRRDNGQIICCIADEGYGIPDNELSGLFERFRRAHLNSGDDQQGIGLGLALVKATAERHGGHVTVQSSEENGSCFCIRLPETSLEAELS